MRDRNSQALPLRRHVRDEIQRRILSGESLPGERFAQQSLATAHNGFVPKWVVNENL